MSQRMMVGAAVVVAAVAAAPAPAGADTWYPSGCSTTAHAFWDSNCWVGFSYEENGHYVVATQTVARLYPQNTICYLTRFLARDGVFGSSTKDAVATWQYGTGSQSGSGYGSSLTPDGIVGSATWARFRSVIADGYEFTSGNYKYLKNDVYPVGESCLPSEHLRSWFRYNTSTDAWSVLMPGGDNVWETVSVF